MKLLVSIDGLRPDAIVRARTPCMDALIQNGSHSFEAQTVMPCCTLPCHTSMLRGVDVTRHGVNTNTFHPLVRPVPSVIDVASNSGLRVGFFYNWGPLRDLHDPESTELSCYHRSSQTTTGDFRLTEAMIEACGRHEFDFVFLYLGCVDECGHAHGWMSDRYLDAVEEADRCVGAVIDSVAVESALILSDHGGHDRTHGTDIPEDMTIPWIAWGQRIKTGFTITEPIVIYDAAPTLAAILEIAPPPQWDGHVIQSMFGP